MKDGLWCRIRRTRKTTRPGCIKSRRPVVGERAFPFFFCALISFKWASSSGNQLNSSREGEGEGKSGFVMND